MTARDAYQYFVLKAQEIAVSKNWSPVNWYDLYIHVGFIITQKKLICTLNLYLAAAISP